MHMNVRSAFLGGWKIRMLNVKGMTNPYLRMHINDKPFLEQKDSNDFLQDNRVVHKYIFVSGRLRDHLSVIPHMLRQTMMNSF